MSAATDVCLRSLEAAGKDVSLYDLTTCSLFATGDSPSGRKSRFVSPYFEPRPTMRRLRGPAVPVFVGASMQLKSSFPGRAAEEQLLELW